MNAAAAPLGGLPHMLSVHRMHARGGVPLPQWLCQQLMKAYFKKDRRQIKLLNECWFFYRNSAETREFITKDV
jgi:hypothetical protein